MAAARRRLTLQNPEQSDHKPMSTLRLGAYKLPAAEVVLVQTLFRLYAHGDAFRWTFVTAPPYDALLADGTTDEGMSPAVDAMAKAVLRLTRMNSGQAPNTLERPIRADRLQDWLKSTEHDLLQTRPATLIEEATQPDAVEYCPCILACRTDGCENAFLTEGLQQFHASRKDFIRRHSGDELHIPAVFAGGKFLLLLFCGMHPAFRKEDLQ